MNWLEIVGLLWLTLIVGFGLGVFWNSDRYKGDVE